MFYTGSESWLLGAFLVKHVQCVLESWVLLSCDTLQLESWGLSCEPCSVYDSVCTRHFCMESWGLSCEPCSVLDSVCTMQICCNGLVFVQCTFVAMDLYFFLHLYNEWTDIQAPPI